MPDNTTKARKKRKPPKNAWKPGQSGNPAGAPKRGQSWKEIYSAIGNLTPKEAADYCRAVAGKLAAIGDQVTLKEAVVLRVYAALMFEPDARLLNAVMDRDEGKVTQTITEIPWREYVKQMGYDPDALMHEAEEIVSKRFAKLGLSSGDSGGDNEAQPAADPLAGDVSQQ